MRPGRYVQLAVSDTGHGMDKATLAHAFEPFFTTKGVGPGDRARARDRLRHREAVGRLRVGLQRARPGHDDQALPAGDRGRPRARRQAHGAGPAPAAKGELVLVVEDEAQVRTIAARALTEAGYRVLEAETGARALEMLAEREPAGARAGGRGHARNERVGSGARARAGRAGRAGPVHLGVHRRRDRAPGAARAGSGVPGEAVFARRAGARGAGNGTAS